MIRPGSASVAIMMNQRPASRSYLTFGANVAAPLRTDPKKVLVETLRTPSGAPVAREKLRMRPLAAKMNCAGPAAPLGSGGSDPSSPRLAAVYDCRNDTGSDASSGSCATAASAGAAPVAATGRGTRRRRGGTVSCCSSSESCVISCSGREHRRRSTRLLAPLGRDGRPVRARRCNGDGDKRQQRQAAGRSPVPSVWTRIGHEICSRTSHAPRGGAGAALQRLYRLEPGVEPGSFLKKTAG